MTYLYFYVPCSDDVNKNIITFSIVTFDGSRSGTVGGLGGQDALKLFLLSARESDPVTQQVRTKRHTNFIMLKF